MVSIFKTQSVLDRLASRHEFTEQDYLTLGEIIRLAFPPESHLAARYAAIAKKYEAGEKKEENAKALRANGKELTALAASVRDMIGQSEKFQKWREQESQEAQKVVNQAYFDSSLFTTTKWVLSASLLLLGIGSIGFTGFNIYAQKAVQDAQKTLTETTAKINETNNEVQKQQRDLKTKQEEAIASIDNQIAAYVKVTKQTIDSHVVTARTAANDAVIAIEKQKKDAGDKLEGLEKHTIDAINKSAKDAAVLIETAKNTGLDIVNTASNEARTAVAKRALDFTNSVGVADTAVEERKKKFNADVDAQFADLKTKLEGVSGQQQKQIEGAGKAAIDRLDADRQAQSTLIARKGDGEISSLETAGVQKRAALDSAFGKSVASLNEALAIKIGDLNSKSADAQKSLEGVVTAVANREKEFTDATNKRFADWDQQVRVQLARLGDLTAASNDQDERLKSTETRLQALQANAKSALEVADQLKNGTRTGELPLIGTVLEKSALLLVLGFALTGLTLLGWLVKLIIWRMHRPAAA